MGSIPTIPAYYFDGDSGEGWLTHRFVAPARMGSNPIYRPLLLGYGQAVRQRTLTPLCAGSNPASPIYQGFDP